MSVSPYSSGGLPIPHIRQYPSQPQYPVLYIHFGYSHGTAVSGAVGGGSPVGDVGETVCLLILATIMKHTLLFIKDWLHSFLSLLFPRCCIVCGRPLSKGEECLCTICNITLPRTNCHLRKDNPVERLFWEQIPLERAPLFSSTGKGVISGRFFIS